MSQRPTPNAQRPKTQPPTPTPTHPIENEILIVDDHPLMRKGIAMTIDAERDLKVTGQVDSTEDVLDQLDAIGPDLVIIDISLPGMNGLELVKHLQALLPNYHCWSSPATTRRSTLSGPFARAPKAT